MGAPGLDPGTSGLKELVNCCVVSVWSRMSKNLMKRIVLCRSRRVVLEKYEVKRGTPRVPVGNLTHLTHLT